MLTRTADSKGRVTLGNRFANRQVMIEELDDTTVSVQLARVIPESEAWLHENPEALSSVRRGLEQAKAGRVSTSPPDLASDQAFADELEDG